MNDDPADRIAKWLVGERLACVLHLGDGALAYRLSAQGHEVVVAGDDVTVARHPQVQYVRTAGERLPFVADSFDVVLVPDLREAPTALAEYARVLRPDGLVSTLDRTHDESVPWVRKLRGIVGEASPRVTGVDTFGASGLFHEAESEEFAAWEQLDLAGLLQFVRATRPGVDDATLARVRELFDANASGTGFLRLRHRTHGLRARVDKSSMTPDAPPPDTLLLDFR
ncbi:class I SAM-dependent methyltransferase [Aeromicrobium marinum]|uniref:class I SAM-dependent methyltransferase n=1 Tax=Aeromicrobium marinum TaxID=219314 RepID=UPI0001BCEA94|nr:methyltransferase domain-containing protein [Aeromicrobium marinum]